MRVRTDAPPERVWAVLADGHRYADWVLGSKEIRRVDGPWPTAGARVHHSVGVGPLVVRDHTEVIDSIPLRLLVLKAHIRPLGVARVRLDLTASGDGTAITMTEEPIQPRWARRLGPVIEVPAALRNWASLRKLVALATGET